MTAYDEMFYPIFGLGCVVAFVLSMIAAWKSGVIGPVTLFALAVFAFWVSLFLGSEIGYQAWQSIPDPPDEAFADTGPMGALFFGWMPGEIFCGLVYGFFRLLRYFLVRERPIVATAIDSQTGREDSGNPYQSP